VSPASDAIAGEIWRHDLHERPSHRSIVTREFLIVPERRTFLAKLNPVTGSAMWSAKVQNTWGWLACTSDRVFYLNQHRRVQCHDVETGEMQWAEDLQGYNGWLVAAGANILVGGWRGYTPLIALDATTGVMRWPEKNWSRGHRVAEPVVGPWGIAVASLDADLVRFLSVETGAIEAEGPLPHHGQAPDASPLLRRHGMHLLLAAHDGRYHQFASRDGSWTVLFEHPDGIATYAPPVAEERVVFMDRAGNLNCYGLQLGERRWSAPWQHSRKDHLPVAISPRGLLAVGSNTGRLSVFDSSGTQLWSKVVAKRIETNIAWLDEQTLVMGTMSALVAFRPPLPQQ